MKLEKILFKAIPRFAIAVFLGILFAPDAGSATRKKIGKRIFDAAENLRNTYEDILTGIVQRIDTMKENRTNIHLHPDVKK